MITARVYSDAEIENAANHCFGRYFKNAAELIMSDLRELHDCAAIDSRGEWVTMESAPRDGTLIEIRWGQDGQMPAWFSDPGAKFPWSFLDKNDGKYFLNTVMDSPYGPTHWRPFGANPPRPDDAGKKVDLEKVFQALHRSAPIPEIIRHVHGALKLHQEAHAMVRDALAAPSPAEGSV